MNISLYISSVHIDIPDKMNKVQGQKLGKFAATTFQKLMEPYVPFRTGKLFRSAIPKAWAIWYPVSYAIYPYKGNHMVNYTHATHALACKEWDKAAYKARGKDLNEAIQKYIASGALNLGGR